MCKDSFDAIEEQWKSLRVGLVEVKHCVHFYFDDTEAHISFDRSLLFMGPRKPYVVISKGTSKHKFKNVT